MRTSIVGALLCGVFCIFAGMMRSVPVESVAILLLGCAVGTIAGRADLMERDRDCERERAEEAERAQIRTAARWATAQDVLDAVEEHYPGVAQATRLIVKGQREAALSGMDLPGFAESGNDVRRFEHR